MIKVLHAITGLEKGGAENHLALLSKIQKKNNYKVKIFYSKPSNYWIKDLNSFGIQTISSQNKSFFFILSDLFTLISSIKTFKPHIVHAHLPYMELICYLALFFLEKKPAFIITKHVDNVFFKGSEGQKKSFIGSFLARQISFKSQKIIAISKAVKNFLTSNLVNIKQKKIKVIYYGLDAVIKKKNKNKIINLRKKYKIKSNQIILGCISRLVYQKSLDTLIDAMSLYKNKKNFKLFVVGTGPLKEQLVNLSRKKKLSKNIYWLDFVDDIDGFLEKIDIFVLPSLYEGLGLVFLEAMLKKKPIVSTKTSAMKELIKQNYNGYLFPKKDSTKLSYALNSLMDKKKRQIMGKNSYIFVKRKFSENKMFKETDNLYRKFL